MQIKKVLCLIIIAFGLLLPQLSFADPRDATEKFQSIFCKLDPAKQSHPILTAGFDYKVKSITEFTCGDLTYRVRVHPDKDDPGHNIYNVDPPSGVKNVLDCDGKADVGMLNIALNCMPISEETIEHVKP